MALVHVEGGNRVVAKPAQKFHSADAENDLLAEAIVPVATIKVISERLVPWRVVADARIQKINWHSVTTGTLYPVTPGAHQNSPPFDTHRCGAVEKLSFVFGEPRVGLFDLMPCSIESLAKVSLSMYQGHADHW
jgi:hypothetical protein